MNTSTATKSVRVWKRYMPAAQGAALTKSAGKVVTLEAGIVPASGRYSVTRYVIKASGIKSVILEAADEPTDLACKAVQAKREAANWSDAAWIDAKRTAAKAAAKAATKAAKAAAKAAK